MTKSVKATNTVLISLFISMVFLKGANISNFCYWSEFSQKKRKKKPKIAFFFNKKEAEDVSDFLFGVFCSVP